MFKIDWQSRTPIYQQIEHRVIELILIGELKEHDQLPSVRSMARELGINPNTIQKAYQDLEGRGIIYSASGRGNFIAAPEAAGEQKRQECFTALRKTVGDAKIAGIARDEINSLVQEVYEDQGDNRGEHHD